MAITLQLVEKEEWQQLAPSFLDYNYRQLWEYGISCANRRNAISEHVAVCDQGQVIGLADVRIKKIPGINLGIAYVNGGPMVRRITKSGDEVTNLNHVLTALEDRYVRNAKRVLRIQPHIGLDGWNDLQATAFKNAGYVFCTRKRPYRTIALDLSASLEKLRADLHQKWRYHLKKAERSGLTIRTGTDEALFTAFLDLYQVMVHRKKLNTDLDAAFYRGVQPKLSTDDRFVISIVYKDDQPIAGQVSSFLGDSCVYLLGATNDEGLRNKAGYLAQWSAVQMSQEKGCRWYDLCGIDPEENPGGYQFKKGMRGIDITAPGPYEMCSSGIRRAAIDFCEVTYQALRN
jgi:hypothetical protein